VFPLIKTFSKSDWREAAASFPECTLPGKQVGRQVDRHGHHLLWGGGGGGGAAVPGGGGGGAGSGGAGGELATVADLYPVASAVSLQTSWATRGLEVTLFINAPIRIMPSIASVPTRALARPLKGTMSPSPSVVIITALIYNILK